ncbi:hypothetical protein ACH5RR_035806 [Cinchona calisaya]|uniref:Pyrrolo-quinoline quinone repeat domain-containing protein n=1 Tax=Cinchona calisaya TaxID=153742 RepID=A0ABD2Y1A9_9GENT
MSINLETLVLIRIGDLTNRRNAVGELLINPTTVRFLRLKWRFIAGFDISATPAVANGVVYFPSWNGYLYAVRADNGALIWKQNLGNLTGLPPTGSYVNVTVSRSTPTIANDLLIVGIYGPAVVIAVKRLNGQLVWLSQLDPRPLAVITTSRTFYLGAFYVGVSSLEELLPIGQCCIFRGSMVKLDARSGTILWQTYTVPDNGGKVGGYSGAAIWGSSPSIDVFRGLVYIATGNLYNAPSEVLKCEEAQNNQTSPPSGPDQCIGPDVHFDSIMAFCINFGQILWSTRLSGSDIYYYACLVSPNNPNCPLGPYNDADFGEAPVLLIITSNGKKRDIVVAVQKSGFAWALDRDNGDIVCGLDLEASKEEEYGVQQQMEKECSQTSSMIDRLPFTLAPSTQTTTAGAWVALDANTGEILWSTANPSNETSPGPVTIVNGLLFAGSVAPNGPFYAMNVKTGDIGWSYNTGATIYGGASASYGCVYIGIGYSIGVAVLHPTWTSGNSTLAFCVV